MKRLTVIAIAAISLLSGCATIASRGELGYFSIETCPVYPATVIDARFLCVTLTEYSDEERWFEFVFGRPLFAAVTLIDFVPSIITDTIMFPYDLSKIQLTTKNKQ